MSSAGAKGQNDRKLLKVLGGEVLPTPPIWLMRQAGRYLAEYRATRTEAGGFLKLCYTPALAAEVTLQPIRRYGFDAAILFSDILVVPDALGQSVAFLEGEGPKLEPITSTAELTRLDRGKTGEKFGLICETVSRLRQDLPKETTLIGFCGAPWTVATYVVGGEGSSDQAAARRFAYRDPKGFQQLIDILVDTSVDYLDQQIKAGADTVMVFDSWAGTLPDREFAAWVTAPTARLVRDLKKRHPNVPVIGFPRGAGSNALGFVKETGVRGVGCDTAMPLRDMRALAKDAGIAVQGNIDPLLLVAGGDALDRRIDETLEAMHGLPHIFNLGHGIVPDTPPENVARLVDRVRAFNKVSA
ncbi:MAG: uroporphyrinogen decarboxylase [Hyphomicrobium sp.]|jgi:uroporphyrinogen decarboxylase|nr:uroporphyrinogen decarboxylase [Hyphomicrobium sp.]PPD07941.1 MAG: uroporphyrinogen decarboxylase [Hyphomicrobium sp.]